MEITGKGTYATIDPYVEQVKQNSNQEARAGKAAALATPEDKVDFSHQAQEIKDAQKAAKALPDVREDKVAEIRQRLETGAYDANADKIAFHMLRESMINQKV
jgi:negative regulator of flagellin synthesis FlgM